MMISLKLVTYSVIDKYVNGNTPEIPRNMKRPALTLLYSALLNLGIISMQKQDKLDEVFTKKNMFLIQNTFSQAKT